MSKTVFGAPSSGGGGSGAMTQIAQVVTTAGQTSISFSSIPQTYNHLLLKSLCASATSTSPFLYMTWNGLTSNYSFSRWGYFSGGVAATVNQSAAFFAAGYMNGNYVGDSGAMAQFDVTFNGYALTTLPKAVFANSVCNLVNNIGVGVSGGQNSSTAAISSISMTISDGSAFTTGSIATLYGLD